MTWVVLTILVPSFFIAGCSEFGTQPKTDANEPAADTTQTIGDRKDGMPPTALAIGAAIGIAWPFGGAENPYQWTGWTGASSGGRMWQTGCGYRSTHSGADVMARDLSRAGCEGVKVYAGFGGKVVVASDQRNGYGNTVVIYDAGRRLAIRYSHLSSIGVYRGQPVVCGQYIGRVGNTGNSSGPHLHLAAYENINNFYGDGYPVIPTLCDDSYYTCGTYFYCW
ncbi:MAG: M23 family metallopeptidase [Patescibacteria group bacterium]